MADNITLNAGSGGVPLATDEIGVGGPHYQLIKLGYGALDSFTIVTATVGLPVSVVAALPAGTNAIGKLAANSGVDIGDVDVTSVVPGTGATNLGKAEDIAHNSGDVGVMALTVRQDTAAALGGTDADYQPLITDTNGRLHVLDANTAAIKTAVELIDDAISGSEMQVDVVAALPAGTNAIGKLAANSGVDIGDVDVTSQPARDRLTDNVGVALQTDALLNDTTALTPKFAKISAASSGNNTLVALVAAKKIRVLSIALFSTGVVDVYLFSTAASIFADATNKLKLDNTGATGAGGFVLPFNPVGWCETASGEALQINLSAAVGVSGGLTYVEV